MLAFISIFLYEFIWRIRHNEETHSVFEFGSEQLPLFYIFKHAFSLNLLLPEDNDT